MAFYKKTKMKVNGKWYPKAVLVSSPATTEQVAKRLAAESTVSPADVRAVLTALGGVMGDYMSQGRSVKLDRQTKLVAFVCALFPKPDIVEQARAGCLPAACRT